MVGLRLTVYWVSAYAMLFCLHYAETFVFKCQYTVILMMVGLDLYDLLHLSYFQLINPAETFGDIVIDYP